MTPDRLMRLAALIEEDCETNVDLFEIADIFTSGVSNPAMIHLILQTIPELSLAPGWSRYGFAATSGIYVYIIDSPERHSFVGRALTMNRAVVAGMLRARAYYVACRPAYKILVEDGKLVKVDATP